MRRALLTLLILTGPARVAWALDNADCFTCHEDKTLVKTNTAGKAVSLFVDPKAYGASIHGKNLCTSCHGDIKDVPHPDNFKAVPVKCSQCHRVESEIYLKSDHGQAIHKGVSEAASCKDCHGHSHTLLNYRDPASPVNRAHIPETCGRCHAKTAEMEKYGLRQRGVVVTYDRSVHGLAHSNGVANAAVCTDCHGSHDLHRATNPASKLYWQAIPGTCARCHENVQQTYSRSVHGKAAKAGIRDAPVCTDCHGEHTITAVNQTASKASPSHIPETCGQCHGSERIASRYQLSAQVVQTYMQSFHGLAQQFGGLTVANCASCHGFHDVLPSSDPLSSVNKTNLPQTCGKCHPGIGTRLAKSEIRIHNLPGTDKGKPWLVNFVTNFYIVIIVLTIGGMVAFNGLDYLAKTRAHIRAVRAGHGELRMTGWVRVQHLALLTLFVTLVYTGFVHRFPDAFWSWPFKVLPNGGYVRGMIHRVAGWGFVLLFVGHLLALFCTPRGQAYLKELWVRLHDLRDAISQVLFNLGLRQTPPPPRRFNYAEKAEYWALVWGSIVMILTGIMLIFTETVLRTLPKVWHDVAQVIHYYEAVLATLAIVVWHFYWVIFDPKEYPMNPAWLIGKKAEHTPPPADPPPHTGGSA
jgi:cytochrome b subunit of formate dehydrogenase/nitrate/TMAO reductase-like tetraheme cytochrome c subunit